MGVYVKGMTTPLGWPRSCEYCIFKDRDWPGYCRVLDSSVKWKDACPLVPVKTPHGRLIDADALKMDIHETDFYYDSTEEKCKRHDIGRLVHVLIDGIIDESPTVIEAEEEE